MNYLIVGFGNIGHKRFGVLGKKCIATVDPSKEATFKTSSDIPENFLNNFQAVIIATSKQPKLELIEYWLKKGKHVLVEKPVILSPKQYENFNRICKDQGVVLYTSYNLRFEPSIVKLRGLLDSNFLGTLYHAEMTYGYGNVKQLSNTWRESGYGVLDEIGSHLVDFCFYMFGYFDTSFKSINLQKVESKTLDHCVFATPDKKIIMTASALYWKNLFQINVYGEKGSIHVSGLCKWGKSTITIATRIVPAGIPTETEEVFEGSDKSWGEDINHFEQLVKQKVEYGPEDLRVSSALVNIVAGGKKELIKGKILDNFQGK